MKTIKSMIPIIVFALILSSLFPVSLKAGAQSPGEVVEPEPAGRIVFAGYDASIDSQGIYVVNDDGTGLLGLTGGSFNDGSPDWSPDGKKIVFHSNRSGDFQIYTMNANGTGLSLLVSLPKSYDPKWSPAGDKIAFWSRPGTDNIIYLVNPDGTGLTPLTAPDISASAPVWNHNGTKIAFQTSRITPGIYTINLDGTGQTLVYEAQRVTGYDWSPDGSRIALSEYGPEPMDPQRIYVLDLASQEKRQVTDLPSGNAIGPSWSPDGSRIAFHSNWEDLSQFHIYTINEDGGSIQKVTAPPVTGGSASWGVYAPPPIEYRIYLPTVLVPSRD